MDRVFCEYDLLLDQHSSKYLRIEPTGVRRYTEHIRENRRGVVIHNVRNVHTIVQYKLNSDDSINADSIEIIFTCAKYKTCERELNRLRSVDGSEIRYDMPVLWHQHLY